MHALVPEENCGEVRVLISGRREVKTNLELSMQISQRARQHPPRGITIQKKKAIRAASQLSGPYLRQGHYFVTFSLYKIAA